MKGILDFYPKVKPHNTRDITFFHQPICAAASPPNIIFASTSECPLPCSLPFAVTASIPPCSFCGGQDPPIFSSAPGVAAAADEKKLDQKKMEGGISGRQTKSGRNIRPANKPIYVSMAPRAKKGEQAAEDDNGEIKATKAGTVAARKKEVKRRNAPTRNVRPSNKHVYVSMAPRAKKREQAAEENNRES